MQESIPNSGSTVIGGEGESITFYCRVLNEANGTQVATEWFLWRRDAGSPQTIVGNPGTNFETTGESLPGFARQTYQTNLTIQSLTFDLDRAVIFCGQGGTPPTLDANFTLRIYRKYIYTLSMTLFKKWYLMVEAEAHVCVSFV